LFENTHIFVGPGQAKPEIPELVGSRLITLKQEFPFNESILKNLAKHFPKLAAAAYESFLTQPAVKDLEKSIQEIFDFAEIIHDLCDHYFKINPSGEVRKLQQAVKKLAGEFGYCFDSKIHLNHEEAIPAIIASGAVGAQFSKSFLTVLENITSLLQEEVKKSVSYESESEKHAVKIHKVNDEIKKLKSRISFLEVKQTRLSEPPTGHKPGMQHIGKKISGKFGKKTPERTAKEISARAKKSVNIPEQIKRKNAELSLLKDKLDDLTEGAPKRPVYLNDIINKIAGEFSEDCNKLAGAIHKLQKEPPSDAECRKAEKLLLTPFWNKFTRSALQFLDINAEASAPNKPTIKITPSEEESTFFQECLGINNGSYNELCLAYIASRDKNRPFVPSPVVDALIDFYGYIFRHTYLKRSYELVAETLSPEKEGRFIEDIKNTLHQFISENKFKLAVDAELRFVSRVPIEGKTFTPQTVLNTFFYDGAMKVCNGYLHDLRAVRGEVPIAVYNVFAGDRTHSGRDIRGLFVKWPVSYGIVLSAESPDSISLGLIDTLGSTVQFNVYYLSGKFSNAVILGESSRIDPKKEGYGMRPSDLTAKSIVENLIPWLAAQNKEKLYVRAHFEGEREGKNASGFFKALGFHEAEDIGAPYMVFEIQKNAKQFLTGSFEPVPNYSLPELSSYKNKFIKNNNELKQSSLDYFYGAASTHDPEKRSALFSAIKEKYKGVSDESFEFYWELADYLQPRLLDLLSK
jgi:hypothetical protein